MKNLDPQKRSAVFLALLRVLLQACDDTTLTPRVILALLMPIIGPGMDELNDIDGRAGQASIAELQSWIKRVSVDERDLWAAIEELRRRDAHARVGYEMALIALAQPSGERHRLARVQRCIRTVIALSLRRAEPAIQWCEVFASLRVYLAEANRVRVTLLGCVASEQPNGINAT